MIVIEHHQAVMAHADWIIDLGPGAGHDGGRIVFEGTPADLVAARSTLTGEHLAAYVGARQRLRPARETVLFGPADVGGLSSVLMRLDKFTIVVEEYDPAIAFFTGPLGFELVEDSSALTNDGRPKRWVVVRPPGGGTGILLARADGEHQRTAVGNQVAGRVGFFLHTEDFDAAHARMASGGVTFVSAAAGRALRPGRGLPRHRRQPLGPRRPARLTTNIHSAHRHVDLPEHTGSEDASRLPQNGRALRP